MRAAQRESQRGLAALTLSLILLLAMTMVAMFAHRSMVFEQRSAANQVRSTQAFELAEAGLAWGLARLNEPRGLAPAPSCEPQAGSAQPLRQRALPWTAACAQASPTAAPQCRCAAGLEALDARDQAGFFLQATALEDTPGGIELVSSACTRLSACKPGTPGFTMQARASTRMVVTTLPLFRLEPSAAVLSAASVVLGPGVSATNTEPDRHGVTLMAGESVSLANDSVLQGLPGTPALMTVREGETGLASWAKEDVGTLFKAFFGLEPEDFRADPLTRVVSAAECQQPAGCGALVAREAAAGYTQFWVEPTLAIERSMLDASGMLGSPERPVVLVVQGDVSLGTGVISQGVWFSLGKALRFRGAGAEVRGAVLAHGPAEFDGPGLALRHAPLAPRGRAVKVPGSWRDFDTSEPS